MEAHARRSSVARRQPSGVDRGSFPSLSRPLKPALVDEPPKAAKARADMGAPSPASSSSPDASSSEESDESSSSDECRTSVGRFFVDFSFSFSPSPASSALTLAHRSIISFNAASGSFTHRTPVRSIHVATRVCPAMRSKHARATHDTPPALSESSSLVGARRRSAIVATVLASTPLLNAYARAKLGNARGQHACNTAHVDSNTP
mmetsp:Transcript_120/g.429  ORF Transcript_120/g.429 Transcript_120/m.429 type:complete len:205 (-) Transcript_120:747-1361(-)